MHTIELPQDCIVELAADAMPKRWNVVPHTSASRAVGDAWLRSGRSLALRVPSIHSNSDTNIVLNPAHPDRKHIRVVERPSYTFDRRMFGGSE